MRNFLKVSLKALGATSILTLLLTLGFLGAPQPVRAALSDIWAIVDSHNANIIWLDSSKVLHVPTLAVTSITGAITNVTTSNITFVNATVSSGTFSGSAVNSSANMTAVGTVTAGAFSSAGNASVANVTASGTVTTVTSTVTGSETVGANATVTGTATAAILKTSTATVGVTGAAGAAPTLAAGNATGNSGQPTTAAQNCWVKMQDSAGATIWIPCWK